MPLWQRLKETTETETTTTETGETTTETGATTTNKPETVTLSWGVGSEPPLPMLKTGPAMRSTLDAMELSAYPRPTFVPREKTNV